ncbi:MAG TPA: hypothetical protein VJ768_09965 [Anaerolineales bacterium]|nr:hypothetical protein [Anaerolineales bacterium]
MNEFQWRRGEPIVIEALGQTWTFTPAVIRLLPFNGGSPHGTLKAIILAHGSMRGYEEGIYEVDSFGITLKFTVTGDAIVVDDPYA